MLTFRNPVASLQQRGKHTVEPSTESKLSSVSNANVEIRFGSQKSALAGLSDTLKLQDLIDASYRLNTPEGPPPTSDRRAFDDSSRTASSASSLSSLWTGGDRSRKPPVPQNSPHLKLKTFDDGTKIAVTVWHAVEFANLRRRLGIDEDAFVRSLSTSEALDAKGGKTAAVFSVTSDRRFVLKQLVSESAGVFVLLTPTYRSRATGSGENESLF